MTVYNGTAYSSPTFPFSLFARALLDGDVCVCTPKVAGARLRRKLIDRLGVCCRNGPGSAKCFVFGMMRSDFVICNGERRSVAYLET